MIRAYLDVETDAAWRLTVVGIFRPDLGCRQWVRPHLVGGEIRQFLEGVDCLMTYNGERFDLPILREQLKVDLASLFKHRDLMYDCWRHKLKGGLKRVEQLLGIHRDTQGIDGLAAIRLWNAFQFKGDRQALDTLLLYNREDVENLEALALKLGVIALLETVS